MTSSLSFAAEGDSIDSGVVKTVIPDVTVLETVTPEVGVKSAVTPQVEGIHEAVTSIVTPEAGSIQPAVTGTVTPGAGIVGIGSPVSPVPTASIPAASAAVSSAVSHGNLIVQLQGGIAPPMSDNAATEYDLGYGGEILVGYTCSPQLTLGVEGGYFSLDTNSYTIFTPLVSGTRKDPPMTHIPVELTGQYYINTVDATARPYVLLGLGLSFDSVIGPYSVTSNGISTSYPMLNESWTNLVVDPGLGISFAALDNISLFVQARVAMNFMLSKTSAATQGTDNIMVLAPFQAGLNYSFH